MVASNKHMGDRGRVWLVIVAALLLSSCGRAATSQAPPSPPSTETSLAAAVSCPITKAPQPPFVPPDPYRSTPSGGGFWYGTPALWTQLDARGTWDALPYQRGTYTQKVFWWRNGYDWKTDTSPTLLVSGVRIDAPAPPLLVSSATNAFASDIGSAMLVGVEIPAAGCWEITGRYKAAALSFVVRVVA